MIFFYDAVTHAKLPTPALLGKSWMGLAAMLARVQRGEVIMVRVGIEVSDEHFEARLRAALEKRS